MNTANNEPIFSQVAAVVLAAGAAMRFGRPKQLERWPNPDSPALVQRAVGLAIAASVGQVYVVTGNQHEKVRELLAEPAYQAARVVINPRWAEGQGYSVAAGVEYVRQENRQVTGILFMLADQPRLKVNTLTTLLEAFSNLAESGKQSILFPVFEGKRGNPVIFGESFFEELIRLEGDAGGRTVVQAHPLAVLEVPVTDPAIHEDVDVPADLEKLTRPE